MSKPWYRQFWPWFVLAPVIGTVVASIVTVYLAGAPPPLVVDELVPVTLAVEQDQRRDRRAAELGLGARVRFTRPRDDGSVGVSVVLDGTQPGEITLSLVHPTLEALDRHAVLERRGTAYAGHIARAESRLYVRLGDRDGEWRLTGTVGPADDELVLGTGHAP